MGYLDGTCDDLGGFHSRSGKFYPWELHKAGFKWLCDKHYQQFLQEEERQKRRRERLQGQNPQSIRRPTSQSIRRPTPQSVNEPTGKGQFRLAGFVIAVIAVCVGVFAYQHVSTKDGSPKYKYKVIVNGVEAVGQGPFSLLQCNTTFYRSPGDATTITASNPATTVGPGNGGASVQVINTDPPQVVMVDLHSYPNKHWSWDGKQQPGNAAVTKSGNTYHIVGTVPPASGSPETQPSGANPVPFEFDATCP